MLRYRQAGAKIRSARGSYLMKVIVPGNPGVSSSGQYQAQTQHYQHKAHPFALSPTHFNISDIWHPSFPLSL